MKPAYVGYWLLPGSIDRWSVQFKMDKKPNWFHRMMMELLLGWEWRDEK